ncbi:MAG: endonuclease Q family protein [Armatimonadota bacterium]
MVCHCDLHVHIGRAGRDRPVKITASRDLTFENIAAECADRKGIGMVGIVDCASPAVMSDIESLLERGEFVELERGGLRYRNKVTVLLASEIETREENGRISHHVSYFPTLAGLREFSRTMSRHVTNLDLSSQTCRLPARELLRICLDAGGMFVPAHSFTPHKSMFGACVRRASDMFPGGDFEKVEALELGLSADTDLADRIAELEGVAFLTNSDAHSLPRIGREHNALEIEEPNFEEFLLAVRGDRGRRIVANYGLDPRLGKYHRTVCEECGWRALGDPPVFVCGSCGSARVINGVLDRIVQIQDRAEPAHPDHRPPYRYQVPLEFVPKIGPVTLNRLINRFGSEMAVVHDASAEALAQTVGPAIAGSIIEAREGRMLLLPGGGGEYGRAVSSAADLQLPLL